MTICALSSGSGQSGVAVLRISGSETKSLIEMITKKSLPPPRKASLLKLYNINTSSLIDEGIVLWFPAPNSYTGEDMAEFHVHGSRAVIEALHDAISKTENCRIAEPGELVVEVLPSPNCPSLFPPQQCTEPSLIIAQEWWSPVTIPTTLDNEST